jgi:hypothetical protein
VYGDNGAAAGYTAKVTREGRKLRVRWTEPRSGDSATMLARRT